MAQKQIAIIGGGPSGLMAAEILSAAGMVVTVYDRKPSVCRKFLMAGRGGLNLTHSEDKAAFMARYADDAPLLQPAVAAFPPFSLRQWCEDLGQETFIGSSGRIFPKTLKASPLLRAWLARLESQDVRFALNHRWLGWQGNALTFSSENNGIVMVNADATLLALGGGSWARLGSDGSWVSLLQEKNIPVPPLQPANSGFHVDWRDHFRTRFAGQPLKTVTATFAGQTIPGEIMIAQNGIEGGPVYALSAALRKAVKNGPATLMVDLKPGLTLDDVQQKISRPRGGQSLSTFLKKTLGLSPVAINLLYEGNATLATLSPIVLAALIKSCPITVTSPFPIDRAISTAGGISFDALDENYMLTALPGIFAAGEMLDWEAPTGGYLLQACFSTGVSAANGIINWLSRE